MALIVFENDDFLIADKPHGIPTVPLRTQGLPGTLLGMVSELCPSVLSVIGRNPWEGGTLHRLDTATCGLVVFAKRQPFHDYLMEAQSLDMFVKTYKAMTFNSNRLVDRFSPALNNSGCARIASYFRSYGPKARQVRPTPDPKRADSTVIYTTLVQLVSDDLFRCTITRGFRHQIRSHLAWIGHPIVGDDLYGEIQDPGSRNAELQLTCSGVSFPLECGKSFNFSV